MSVRILVPVGISHRSAHADRQGPASACFDSTGTYDVDRYAWAYDVLEAPAADPLDGRGSAAGRRPQGLGVGPRDTTAERDLLHPDLPLLHPVGRRGRRQLSEALHPDLPAADRVQMMMAAFTNMETVHIDAYALLLKTLGMPKTEFEAFRDYSEMRAKADYMHDVRRRHGRGRRAHARHVRRLHRRHGAVRQLRDAAELPAPQQDERHGPDRHAGRCATKACIAKASSSCSTNGNRETGAVTHGRCATTSSMWQDRWWGWRRASSISPSGLGEIEGMTPGRHPLLCPLYRRLAADASSGCRPCSATSRPPRGSYAQVKPHPLPWLVEILNGVEHANFFEQRATRIFEGRQQRRMGRRGGCVGGVRSQAEIATEFSGSMQAIKSGRNPRFFVRSRWYYHQSTRPGQGLFGTSNGPCRSCSSGL